jgi:phenylacetate-CoA ligase
VNTAHPKLADLVQKWLREVPLYQRLSPQPVIRDNFADFDRSFLSVPIITKQDIRSGFPNNFLGSNHRLEDLISSGVIELEQTSGTSEEPTPLLLGKGWWPTQERAALNLNRTVTSCLTANPSARRVVLASPSCNHDISYRGVPARSQRTIGNALYANLMKHPLLWPVTERERIAQEISDWQPLFLDVDPVYGVSLAQYCRAHGVRFPSLKFIISSYEYLSCVHRELMTSTFQVPVYNLYGSTETGHLLMEDLAGRMQASEATAYLELVDADDAGVGRLIVTTLTNEFMPLIRYEIGDLARRLPVNGGFSWEIQGRLYDCLTDTRNRRLTVRQVDDAFWGERGVLHYQLRQLSVGDYQLLLVLQEPGDQEAVSSRLKPRLAELLGTESGLRVQAVDFLLSESSGKFRLCCREDL